MSSDLHFKRPSGFQKQVFSPQDYAYFPRPMLIRDSMTSLHAYDPCLKNCLGIFHAELEGGEMEVSSITEPMADEPGMPWTVKGASLITP